MAVTLQELFFRDSDPHGFLTMKGRGEWKIREMDMFIECLYSFSKCLLARHSSSGQGDDSERGRYNQWFSWNFRFDRGDR